MGPCDYIAEYVEQLHDLLESLSRYTRDGYENLGNQIDEAIGEVLSGPEDSDDADEDAGLYAEDCEIAQEQYDLAVEWIGYTQEAIAAYGVTRDALLASIRERESIIAGTEEEIERLNALFAQTEDQAIPGQIAALQDVIRAQQGAIDESYYWLGLVDEAVARLEGSLIALGFLKGSAEQVLAICASGSLPPEPESAVDQLRDTPSSTPEEGRLRILAGFLLDKLAGALQELDACEHAVEEGKPVPPDSSPSWIEFREDGLPESLFPFTTAEIEEIFGDRDAGPEEAPDELDPEAPEGELPPDEDDLPSIIDEVEADRQLLEDAQDAVDRLEVE